ncbi:conserved Plasmodium protein, unknown function [Plasmodium malariae]|nr:conserved Plasmodium protein, unknown function [Plasmodium malariae]
MKQINIKNYIVKKMNIFCCNFLKVNKGYMHVLFTNEKKAYNKFFIFKSGMENEHSSKSKIVLFNIEEERNKIIRKKINNSLIGGVIISSLSICLIEINIISSLCGFVISAGLILFYIFYFLFYNSVILRAVLDIENKSLLLYPYMILKRKNLKKQIILSLHEINKVNKVNNYIQLYLKKPKIKIIPNFNLFIPLHIPRYNTSKTSKPQEIANSRDVLYPYDYNNLNISVFSQRKHMVNVPTIKKNVDGYPLNVAEENKLISLLSV